MTETWNTMISHPASRTAYQEREHDGRTYARVTFEGYEVVTPQLDTEQVWRIYNGRVSRWIEEAEQADSLTVVHEDADFDARAYRVPGHAEGLRANDPITLASLFGILAHANHCTGCGQCLVDGN
jgi:hypothetical protein